MDLFDKMGIIVDKDVVSFEKDKTKYKKIESSLFEMVDQSLKLIPTLIDASFYDSDVYRVIYNKGIGVLQKSAKHPGMLLANVVEDGTNNKFVDVARLQVLSNTPQVLSGAFNAMSIVTGQYFMSKIDSRLKNLEKGVEAVQDYLEDSRRSELVGNLDFLKETHRRLIYFADDTILATSTLTAVQTIKINALGNLTFYREQIIKLEAALSDNDKFETIMTNINDMYRLISEYWFTLQLYCYSSYLEPQIGQNTASQLIHEIAEDIETKCKTYRKQYKLWKETLEKYVEKAKAFEENQIFKYMKNMDLIAIGRGTVLVQGVAKIVGTIANKWDTKKKGKNYEIVIDEITKKAPNTNTDAVMEMQKELLLLEQIYSDRVEVVKQGNEIYYRIGEERLQEEHTENKSRKDKRKGLG